MECINVKTAIIGSGIAGISASVNLLENNYKDFLLFEACNRIGGRIHTIDFEHSFLEMGAQFIHGQLNNPIYYIARDNKQIEEIYNEIISDDEDIDDNSAIPVDFEQSYFVTENGDKLDLKFVNDIYKITSQVLVEKVTESSLEKDVSIAHLMLERFNKIIDEKYSSKMNKNLKSLIEGLFIWRCKCENIENGSRTLTNLSSKHFCFWKELKGSQIIELKNGYKHILEIIIKKYENEFNSKLRLKHVLKKIILCSKDETNCLHCSYTNKDSNKIVAIINDLEENKDLIVICENIVCTMSLGYLKENLTNLIEPVSFISNEKQMAVSRIGYGTVNKIFLFYEKPFWDENLSGIQPIWLLNENETILSKLNDINELNWYESISYFDRVKDHKNVLCAWLSGCEFFEQFSNEKISNDCTLLLRKFLNNNNIPEPIKILKSTWHSNKYFKGSYSNLPLNSNPSDFEDIAKPIFLNDKPVVMFAGEATISDYYSTVHGAYLSGMRESLRLINDQ